MRCPGAPNAFWNAFASLLLRTTATCDEVVAEIRARVNGTNGWIDPHNQGTYTMINDFTGVQRLSSMIDPRTNKMIADAGTMRLERKTGKGTYMLSDKVALQFAASGKYTDVMMFSFADRPGKFQCQITACSESQVNSYLDLSTNYCNIRNLYCGKEDGCPVAGQDIGEYREALRSFSRGAGKDKSRCIVKEWEVTHVEEEEKEEKEDEKEEEYVKDDEYYYYDDRVEDDLLLDLHQKIKKEDANKSVFV